MSILIAIPTLGLVSTAWCIKYWELEFPINTRGEIFFIEGQGTVAQKREDAVNYAIANNYSHIFFLDDDVLPPKDTLKKLIAHDKEVVGGIYYHKSMPSFPLVFKKRGDGAWLDYPRSGLFRAYGFGMGCSLIQTNVFKRMQRPWFAQDEMRSKTKHSTEEFKFWDWLKNNKIPLYIDPTIQCGHIDKDNKFKIYKEGTAEER